MKTTSTDDFILEMLAEPEMAFPLQYEFPSGEGVALARNPGMTIRDYFAIHSLPVAVNLSIHFGPDHFAKTAYEMADAMLEARKK